jgi:GNAT superfamily N-acetyltransferase
MNILKIKLNELSAFCESRLFRSFPVKPVSPLRVASYLNNPRANGDDTVLYMFVADSKLIAFRTILPDYVLSQGKTVRFGWCSGTWVDPEHRGQKLSKRLLLSVMEDWRHALMFTNYTLLSEQNNLSTRSFNRQVQRTGLRFYLYPNLNQIYMGRNNYDKIKCLLPFLSFGISALSYVRSSIYHFFCSKMNYTEQDDLDQECKNYLKTCPETFFNRKEKDLDWIIQYPWVTQTGQDDCVYPFSYLKKDYSLKVVKMGKENTFSGFFIYTIIQSKMKILYYFMDADMLPRMLDVVFQIALKNRIEYLTVLDFRLAWLLKRRNNCFAFSRSYTSHIYSSIVVSKEGFQTVFDGDGDYCFT